MDVATRVLGRTVHVADSDSAALLLIRRGDADRIVWEVSATMPAREMSLPIELLNAVRTVPVLLVVDGSCRGSQAVADLATSANHLQVALIGADQLSAELTSLATDPPTRGAEQALVQRMPRWLSRASRRIVLLAAIAAKRRLTVRAFAAICGLSAGTLAYRFTPDGISHPSALCGLFLTAHTVWRLDVLGLTSKRSASEAGFHSAAALANYIRRHTGWRPGDLARQVGFVRLANHLESLLVTAADPEAFQRLDVAPLSKS